MKDKILKNKFFLLTFFLFIFFAPEIFINEKSNPDGVLALKMVILMIFLWLTELIQISITALIPIIFYTF